MLNILGYCIFSNIIHKLQFCLIFNSEILNKIKQLESDWQTCETSQFKWITFYRLDGVSTALSTIVPDIRKEHSNWCCSTACSQLLVWYIIIVVQLQQVCVLIQFRPDSVINVNHCEPDTGRFQMIGFTSNYTLTV